MIQIGSVSHESFLQKCQERSIAVCPNLAAYLKDNSFEYVAPESEIEFRWNSVGGLLPGAVPVGTEADQVDLSRIENDKAMIPAREIRRKLKACEGKYYELPQELEKVIEQYSSLGLPTLSLGKEFLYKENPTLQQIHDAIRRHSGRPFFLHEVLNFLMRTEFFLPAGEPHCDRGGLFAWRFCMEPIVRFPRNTPVWQELICLYLKDGTWNIGLNGAPWAMGWVYDEYFLHAVEPSALRVVEGGS